MKIAILCGGEGKRLRPFTEDVPKALIPINGQPILEHILRLYIGKGFYDFILCIGYKGKKIREFINSTPVSDVPHSIEFSDAGESASMLSRIYKLKDSFDRRLMISYGDTLTNLDLHDFLKFHEQEDSIATIVVARIRSPFGLVTVSETGKAKSFDEKPDFLYYIGHILLEKKAYQYMTADLLKKPDGKGLVHFFQKLIADEKLHVYLYSGQRITFNTHEDREKADEIIKAFYTLDERRK